MSYPHLCGRVQNVSAPGSSGSTPRQHGGLDWKNDFLVPSMGGSQQHPAAGASPSLPSGGLHSCSWGTAPEDSSPQPSRAGAPKMLPVHHYTDNTSTLPWATLVLHLGTCLSPRAVGALA